MTRAVAELNQIPFSQLIGAPLKAAVEAQALAAQSTIEFIHKVGFRQNDQGLGDQPDLLFDDPTADADAGDLRSVTFRYTKKDENGDDREFELSVPLLAITPIPYIRIDEMTIDFTAKLTDAIERRTDTAFDLNTQVGGSYGSFWSPVKVEARVSATFNTKSSVTDRQHREYALEIHVRAVQDEIPSGLARLLDMLEAAIKDDEQAAAPA